MNVIHTDVVNYNRILKKELIELFTEEKFLNCTMEFLLPTKHEEVTKIRSKYRNNYLN
jgi:hypothetical protein